MIEPRTSLALSVHANPGVYALLLGSGISRAANIPTGWEVVKDLIRKVAHASGENCGPDPIAWYQNKYATVPTYSVLLEAVGKSAAERSRILKGYFEPNEEELENGDKQPTKAHQAIAQLVKRGTVRVILTTNFDRLMEQALAEEGISPSVISTPGAVEGAIPLAHSDCTVIKLHGDYLDLDTKNTPMELSEYDERVDKLLDRVFDEYGLIVCGWSGEWDTALRDAIKRCKNRRFTMWWASMGKPARDGQDIIDVCRAQVIPIQGADEFFEDLSERLSALDQFARPHPISTKIAVELTKKYLSEPKYRIKLHDLLMSEVEKIVSQVCSEKYPVSGQFGREDYAQRILDFEAISEVAVHIMATGCYWDEEQRHLDTWLKAINRLANDVGDPAGDVIMANMRKHPARLLLYSAGVAFAQNNHFAALHAIFSNTFSQDRGQRGSLVLDLTGNDYWSQVFKCLPGLERRILPVSNHMYDALRLVFVNLASSEDEFQQAFDRFETLQSLHGSDADEWPVPGTFMQRRRPDQNPTLQWLSEAAATHEGHSPLLSAGFCDGEEQRFTKAMERLLEMAKSIYWQR